MSELFDADIMEEEEEVLGKMFKKLFEVCFDTALPSHG